MAFTKIKFITWLRNNGGSELIHFYNQGADNRLSQMDTTSQGWCHGVAVQWLKDKAEKGYDNTDFWTWIDTAQAAGAFRFLMADQSVRPKLSLMLANRVLQKGFADRATAQRQFDEDSTNKSSTYLLKSGLSLKNKYSSGIGSTLNLARDITGTAGNFARIGMFFTTGGGHAVSACTNGRYWLFMDPNAGEIQLRTKSEFNSWFPKYYSMRYSTMPLRSYYVEKY